MAKAVMVLAMVAICLFPTQALDLWSTANDYLDYLVVKNCFGEDVAAKLERNGMMIGKKCWMKEWNNKFGNIGDTKTIRSKRNIIKMPGSPTNTLLLCNLQAMNLLTPEYKMNYQVVDDFLASGQLEEDLSQKLQELSENCKTLPVAMNPGMPSGSPGAVIKGMMDFKIYMGCMNSGGMHICMAKELKKLQEKIGVVSSNVV